jgi:hypothetical protein
MNVPEVSTTAAVILIVSTLSGVFHADVTMVIPEMECHALVGVAICYYVANEIK